MGSAPRSWLGPQLGLDEVQAVLLDLWETAAELLPDAIGDQAGLSWPATPTTELRMTCEQPADNGVLPDLDKHVDLTPLCPTDGGSRSRMAVTITTAPAMIRAERQRLVREALVYMARQFGYVDAEVDVL